jgi:hypothetical protein
MTTADTLLERRERGHIVTAPEDIVAILTPELSQKEAAERFRTLQRSTTGSDLASALRLAAVPRIRQVICDLLGKKRDPNTLDALVDALSDSSTSVRASAADAIGKVFGYVENPPVGHRARVVRALLDRWAGEDSDAVRSTLAQTLALVGDQSVRPVLEAALDHPDRQVRGQAAWGLRHLSGQQL